MGDEPLSNMAVRHLCFGHLTSRFLQLFRLEIVQGDPGHFLASAMRRSGNRLVTLRSQFNLFSPSSSTRWYVTVLLVVEQRVEKGSTLSEKWPLEVQAEGERPCTTSVALLASHLFASLLLAFRVTSLTASCSDS